MSIFFSICAVVASLGLLGSLTVGHLLEPLGLSLQVHLLLGLGSAVFSALLHCLVFAIFTGSGKDARLLVQHLGLKPEYLATVKRFRRDIFPPALRAIGALLLVSVLGGALGSGKVSGILGYAHPVVAWFGVLYNIYIFRKEAIAISVNSRFIHTVNSEAAQEFSMRPAEPEILPDSMPYPEFAKHAHAMGRFACFLAYNIWLPYLYLRFVMAMLWVSWVPFLLASVGAYALGKYLQRRFNSTLESQ